VIAGRSVVAFRRAEGDPVPPPKCFGFVQTYDEKPRQRLWEVMKSQGMQESQQVIFIVRWRRGCASRAGVLAPQRRTHHRLVSHHDAADGAATTDQGAAGGARIQGRGGVQAGGERQAPAVARQCGRSVGPRGACCWMRKRSAPADKLATGVADFETYIRNNRESIPNFGELYRQGETISTAFVESRSTRW
jgi:hypothetical protein